LIHFYKRYITIARLWTKRIEEHIILKGGKV